MAKKILLTGQRGYIGACLYQYLSQQAEVQLLSERLENLSPYSQQADLVIHCASDRRLDVTPACLYQSNEKGTICLLRSLKTPTPLIYLSSRMVYGSSLSLYKETDLPQPDTPYGRSKWATEQLIQTSSFPHLILRLTGVWGWGVNKMGRTFPEQALAHFLADKPVTFYKNSTIRDYLYIWDLVAQIDFLLHSTHPWPSILNLSGKPRLLLPLLKMLARYYFQAKGKKPNIHWIKTSPIIDKIGLDSSLAQTFPGFPPLSDDKIVIQRLVQATLKENIEI